MAAIVPQVYCGTKKQFRIKTISATATSCSSPIHVICQQNGVLRGVAHQNALFGGLGGDARHLPIHFFRISRRRAVK